MKNSLLGLKQAFKNPQLRRYMTGNYVIESCVDSGSGIPAGCFAEVASNEIQTGTESSSAIAGVVRSTVAASGTSDVENGFVPVKLGTAVTKLDQIASRNGGLAGEYMSAQTTILSATAGGNFGNQPAGDGVEIVSDDTGDTTQTVTIYGTITGTTDSITSETVDLDGTTVVSTDETTWQNILAVKLSASCAGTVTVREASADQTITTITTGNTSAGVATATTTNGFGRIPRHDASGASTAPVAIIGLGLDGTALSVVDALNGTTEEDHGTTQYSTVSEIYVGAVASSVNVTILSNEATDVAVGIALESGSIGDVVDAYVKPYYG